VNAFPGGWSRARLALALLLAGSCAPPEAPSASPLPRVLARDFPVRLLQDGRELEVPAPPRRILPANAAWIDFLSLLAGPERVVALPSEAFGYSRLGEDPGAWRELPPFPVFEGERILALAPDLVLAHTWQNPETIATLRRAGIPVLCLPVPRSWDEITGTLALLAVVLGESARAEPLLDALEGRRAALARRAAPLQGVRVLSYTNLGAGGWASAAHTTGDVLIGLAGLRNAAADAGLEGDVPADAERLLALAPDVFLVGRPDASESAPPSEEFLLAEPALRGLAAVRAHRIVSLPPALFTSASPELLTGAERLVAELERMESPASPR